MSGPRRDDGVCCAECGERLHAEDGQSPICDSYRLDAGDSREDDLTEDSYDGVDVGISGPAEDRLMLEPTL
jgi:hypothetical protein